eukprot:624921-Alexandrium_andersonii.AAC.1
MQAHRVKAHQVTNALAIMVVGGGPPQLGEHRPGNIPQQVGASVPGHLRALDVYEPGTTGRYPVSRANELPA